MNRDQAKIILKNIEMLKAFAEGKEIQFEEGGSWWDRDDLMFNLPPEKYRIKPAKIIRPYHSDELPCCGTVLVRFGVPHVEYPIERVDRSNCRVMLEGYWVEDNELLWNWRYPDGKRCGVDGDVAEKKPQLPRDLSTEDRALLGDVRMTAEAWDELAGGDAKKLLFAFDWKKTEHGYEYWRARYHREIELSDFDVEWLKRQRDLYLSLNGCRDNAKTNE